MIDYNGYIARIQFDKEDQVFVGEVIGIDDIITFHSENEEDIVPIFHSMVDDYLKTGN
jgi:predicted HicB family RNase H-like nuclease